MSDASKIEWTDATWNPVTGCSVVSAGCKHCYAMRLAGTRLRHHPSRAGLTRPTSAGPVWTGKVRFNAGWLAQPLSWIRPRRIFVCAHGDLFHPAAPDNWIDHVFAVMALAPQHTFQVLTKRPERMLNWFTGGARPNIGVYNAAVDLLKHQGGTVDWGRMPRDMASTRSSGGTWWPLPNVWLGVSVEDQPTADERIPLLLQTPAAVRFISAEPLLGAINLRKVDLREGYASDVLEGYRHDFGIPFCDLDSKLDWVITGGESGPGARPSHPEWFTDLRDECVDAGVPFFFKQWGEWANSDIDVPQATWFYEQRFVRLDGTSHAYYDIAEYDASDAHMHRVGKRAAGRLLDGRTWDEFPREAAP